MVESKQSCLKDLLKVALVLILFESILAATVYFWRRDSFAEWVMTAFWAQLVFGLLVTPVFLVALAWTYWQNKKWGAYRAVMVWVWRNKAYLPVLAEVKQSYFVDIAPVHVANLNRDDLTRAINNVIETGHQRKTAQAEKVIPDPLLVATQVSSREELKSDATVFIIRWIKKSILLDVVNEPNDFQQLQIFPPDISLDTIANAILDYVYIGASNVDEESNSGQF